jgi:hypothetical protein
MDCTPRLSRTQTNLPRYSYPGIPLSGRRSRHTPENLCPQVCKRPD